MSIIVDKDLVLKKLAFISVDLKIVHKIVTMHLDDLLGYVHSIRARIK